MSETKEMGVKIDLQLTLEIFPPSDEDEPWVGSVVNHEGTVYAEGNAKTEDELYEVIRENLCEQFGLEMGSQVEFV